MKTLQFALIALLGSSLLVGGCVGINQAKEKATDLVQKSYVVIKKVDDALHSVEEIVAGTGVEQRIDEILVGVDDALEAVLDGLITVGDFLDVDLDAPHIAAYGEQSLEDAVAELRLANDGIKSLKE